MKQKALKLPKLPKLKIQKVKLPKAPNLAKPPTPYAVRSSPYSTVVATRRAPFKIFRRRPPKHSPF
jgi:hypothetical protein